MLNETDIEALAVGFYDWLHEVEVYGTRYERLQLTFDELSEVGRLDLMQWLYAAYRIGQQHKEKD